MAQARPKLDIDQAHKDGKEATENLAFFCRVLVAALLGAEGKAMTLPFSDLGDALRFTLAIEHVDGERFMVRAVPRG